MPQREQPLEVSGRVDRLIDSLKKLSGNVALFTHGHLGRVLGCRWIGLPIEAAEHFRLDTGSISILCYEQEHEEQTLWLWNSSPLELAGGTPKLPQSPVQSDATIAKRDAIEQWENEGGEVTTKVAPLAPPLMQSST